MATLTAEQLTAAFRGLEPNWYSTAELHARHVEWAAREGREPESAKTVGESIRRTMRHIERRTGHKGGKLWYVSDRVLAGRDWFDGPDVTVKCQDDSAAQMSSEPVPWPL